MPITKSLRASNTGSEIAQGLLERTAEVGLPYVSLRIAPKSPADYRIHQEFRSKAFARLRPLNGYSGWSKHVVDRRIARLSERHRPGWPQVLQPLPSECIPQRQDDESRGPELPRPDEWRAAVSLPQLSVKVLIADSGATSSIYLTASM